MPSSRGRAKDIVHTHPGKVMAGERIREIEMETFSLAESAEVKSTSKQNALKTRIRVEQEEPPQIQEELFSPLSQHNPRFWSRQKVEEDERPIPLPLHRLGQTKEI